MFKKLVEWFSSFWTSPVSDFIGEAYWDEYESLIKSKYGIAEPWADDEDDQCSK